MSKHTALKVDVEGNITRIEFEQNASYDMLKTGVDGWIECVRLDNGIDMWLNEEGKILGLPMNYFATVLWINKYGMTDVMCGNAILTSSTEDGDTVGLTDEQLDFLRPLFGVSTNHAFPYAILNGGE